MNLDRIRHFTIVKTLLLKECAKCVSFPGCCNKIPQMGRLKIREIYSLAILEARNPKSRCWQGHALSEVSRGESFIAFSSF